MKQNIILVAVMILCGLMLYPPVQTAHGLGQRQAVKYIRAITANLELTPTQVDGLTKQQAATYILDNYPSITTAKLKELVRFWSGIKGMLRNDAVERRTQVRLILLRQQLNSAYPDAVGLQTEYAKDIARQLLPLLYGEVDPNAL